MARILLIEPDRMLTGTIRSYFANANHQTIVHQELQQAIAAADNNPPDGIVMELQLAGRSGIEFLYELRSYPDWQDIPVIIYTALKKDELADYGRVLADLNVSAVIYKPESGLDTLMETVENQLSPAKR